MEHNHFRDPRPGHDRPLELLMGSTAGHGLHRVTFPMCYGSCYSSKDFAQACRTLKLKHKRTRPDTPKTNGKAERFIQTALREWAYARAYQNSHQRACDLPTFIHRYNWHRPHGSLKAKTPISRLNIAEDNLLRLHI